MRQQFASYRKMIGWVQEKSSKLKINDSSFLDQKTTSILHSTSAFVKMQFIINFSTPFPFY